MTKGKTRLSLPERTPVLDMLTSGDQVNVTCFLAVLTVTEEWKPKHKRGVGKGLLGKREEFFDCTKSETLMEGVFVYCQK